MVSRSKLVAVLLGGSQIPAVISGEIGNVDASTVVINFNIPITALNYSAGVTIKKGGVVQTILSATVQAGNRSVYFVLDTPAVYGDVLTWEYDEAAGSYTSLYGTQDLPDVPPFFLTNNISDVLALRFYYYRNSQYLALRV